MPRGGSLNLPTAADVPRPRMAAPASTTEETKPRRRKMGVLPVVFAILVAAGFVILIAWQAAPWLTDSGSKTAATKAPAVSASTPSPSTATQAPAALPEVKKPSPMPTATADEHPALSTPAAKPETASATPDRGPIPPPEIQTPAHSQPRQPAPREPAPDLSSNPYVKVSVTTVPADATAMLDDRPDSACTTPCALDATPGQHTVTIKRDGYQTEHRPVTVGSTGLEMPTIALRVPGGVLMLASVPPGAHVFVNGTAADKVTPATLVLRPGKYNIGVEKDGKRFSKEVEIQNGVTSYEKIIMDR